MFSRLIVHKTGRVTPAIPRPKPGCPMRMATSGIKSSAARTLRQPAARHVQVRAIQEPETQTAEPAFEVPPPAPDGMHIQSMTASEARTWSSHITDEVLNAIVWYWHRQALQAHLLDYSTADKTGTMIIEVDGPAFTSRALAIIHLAMWDAYVGISQDAGTYCDYDSLPDVDEGDKWVAISFAVTAAASVAIKNLYKGQADKLHLASQSCTFYTAMNNASSISYSAIHTGIQWGEKAAQAIMDKRAGDGSENVDVMTCFPDDFEPQAYDHQPDPQTEDVTGKEQKNYAVGWGDVASFGFADLKATFDRLETPRPPQTQLNYTANFNEVKCVGRRDSEMNGDCCDASRGRRKDEELITGIFWAYDGAYRVGLPNRLYNQCMDAIVKTVDAEHKLSPFRRLRVYTVANVAMADAAIAAWDNKYFHTFWRPTVGIRYDPNETVDADWLPYGKPTTNKQMATQSENPNFPAYPSGHATIGTSAFTAIRTELSDMIGATFKYKFQSSEYDGVAQDASGCRRPCITKELTIDESIKENQDARTFIGVHWRFDSEKGGELGQKIGAAVSQSFPAQA